MMIIFYIEGNSTSYYMFHPPYTTVHCKSPDAYEHFNENLNDNNVSIEVIHGFIL